MFNYNFNTLNSLFFSLIQSNLDNEAFEWLKGQADIANEIGTSSKFKIGFSMVARKVPNGKIKMDRDAAEAIDSVISGFSITDWDLKKLCRVWLIMQIGAGDRNTYISKIEDLFKDADMNELATLYASLPLLAYPEHWQKQCSEGIRSNIGLVLDAVIMDNPYPASYLQEEAWNQLILKAFFTDKEIHRIVGWEKRVNESLVKSLTDYADERKAANREINPRLWEIVQVLEQNQ